MKRAALRDKLLLAYLAGVADGEGGIGIYKRLPKNSEQRPGYVLRFVVTQTIRSLPEMFQRRFGGAVLIERRGHKGWKDCYDWVSSSNIAANALRLLIPYMTVKKPQAELALRFQTAKFRGYKWVRPSDAEVERRETLYLSMKAMNRRGR